MILIYLIALLILITQCQCFKLYDIHGVDLNVGFKDLKISRDEVFISTNDNKIKIIRFNDYNWTFHKDLEPPIFENFTIREYGRNIDILGGTLLISGTIDMEGAVMMEYTKQGSNNEWVYTQLIYISTENNGVVYPRDSHKFISMRSQNEFAVFTVDNAFQTAPAFIKIFKKTRTGLWELQQIFNPQFVYSIQNYNGMICWSKYFLFVSFLDGEEKIECYSITNNYTPILIKEYNTVLNNDTFIRDIDCFDEFVAVSNPTSGSGNVHIFNPSFNNEDFLYEITPPVENITEFGRAISIDATNLFISSYDVIDDYTITTNTIYTYDDSISQLVDYSFNNRTYETNIIPLQHVSEGVFITNLYYKNSTDNVVILQREDHTFTPTIAPTFMPTDSPSVSPTKSPSKSPTTGTPTRSPTTGAPTLPTSYPTRNPTHSPTTSTPTKSPTPKFDPPKDNNNIYMVFLSSLLIMVLYDLLSYYSLKKIKSLRIKETKVEEKYTLQTKDAKEKDELDNLINNM